MTEIDRRPGIRPRLNLGRRLDIAARAGVPCGITVMLMLLTQAPLGIPEQAALLPAVSLCCVWFWSLSRPDHLPAPLVFLLGLTMDLVGYLPIGVGVFTLLAVHGLALAVRQPLSHRGFVWGWIVFGAVAGVASSAIWLLVMLLSFRLLSPYPALFMAILTIAIFPILAVPFAAAHRSIADPVRA
jgi:rod shape-determining protein MreD